MRIDTAATTSGRKREERREHERQHGQRADATDQDLGEHPRPAAVRAGRQRVLAGDTDGRPRRCRRSQRAPDRVRRQARGRVVQEP